MRMLKTGRIIGTPLMGVKLLKMFWIFLIFQSCAELASEALLSYRLGPPPSSKIRTKFTNHSKES